MSTLLHEHIIWILLSHRADYIINLVAIESRVPAVSFSGGAVWFSFSSLADLSFSATTVTVDTDHSLCSK